MLAALLVRMKPQGSPRIRIAAKIHYHLFARLNTVQGLHECRNTFLNKKFSIAWNDDRSDPQALEVLLVEHVLVGCHEDIECRLIRYAQ